ncbi:MFS transporter [Ornithinibacillus scapharcae]|uniref:MFS transporter n=1 Tax=Ornithinibacillus scapharcae TaxID=1147159 RepID=UPI000225BE23|nr:MFS transporter [Ornithinibacillus scapharcae]
MTRQTYILAILIFLLSTGGYMAMPLFPLLTDIHDITLTMAGTLTGIYIFTQKATPVIFGPLGDIYSHKKLAISGELIRGIGFIGVGSVSDFFMLILFTSFAGLGGGVASSSLQSLMMHSTNRDKRARVSSLRSCATNAGLLAGPILAGLVIWTGHFNFVFITAGIMYILGAVLLMVFVYSSVTGSRFKKLTSFQFKEVLNNRAFMRLLVFMLLFHIVFAQLFVTLPEYAKQLTNHIQTVLLLNGITGLVLQYPVGVLISKFNRATIFIYIGMTLISLSFITLAMWNNNWILYIAVFMYAIGSIFIIPIMETSIANHSDKSGNIGLYFGISNLSDGVGRPIGSIMGGWLLFTFQPSIVWLIFSIFSIVILIYFFCFLRNTI